MNRILAALAALLLLPTMPARAEPLRVAVLEDLNSVYAESSGPGDIVAAQMAIEDFGGNVLGRKIELLTGDHQNKADVAATLARKWFDIDGVRMVTGLSNSAVALAVQQVAREKGRIDIVSGAAATELTGSQCSPTGFHWTYDTYGLTNGTTNAIIDRGGKDWAFITADYAFGHSLQDEATRFILARGGRVLGAANAPLGTNDFSAFLVSAQATGAKVVALANAGTDTINSIKQAAEFGLPKSGITLAGLLVSITNIHALGLPTTQGLIFTESYYWDRDEPSRAFGHRFLARHGAMPTMQQAGVYSGTLHYLKAVRAAGTDESLAVAAKMRELPIEDFMSAKAYAREDGRVVRDLYILQAKTPAESTGEWDLMKILRTIPGEQAFRSLAQSECRLVVK